MPSSYSRNAAPLSWQLVVEHRLAELIGLWAREAEHPRVAVSRDSEALVRHVGDAQRSTPRQVMSSDVVTARGEPRRTVQEVAVDRPGDRTPIRSDRCNGEEPHPSSWAHSSADAPQMPAAALLSSSTWRSSRSSGVSCMPSIPARQPRRDAHGSHRIRRGSVRSGLGYATLHIGLAGLTPTGQEGPEAPGELWANRGVTTPKRPTPTG